MKEPKYNNEDLLKKCMVAPISLIWDTDFENLNTNEVNDLCSDLEKFYDWTAELFKKTPLLPVTFHDKNGFKRQIEHREEIQTKLHGQQSLVWAAIFHCHIGKLEEKYLEYTKE